MHVGQTLLSGPVPIPEHSIFDKPRTVIIELGNGSNQVGT